MSDTEQKTNDIGKSNFSDTVLDIFFLLGILAVAFLWISIVAYIIYHKDISFLKEFEIAKLGQTGDFFNISTSLASFVTVLIVYRGFLLQKKELTETSKQLKYQKDSMEKEEQVNRTMKIVDEWEELRTKKADKVNYEDVDRFLKKIRIIMRHDGYNNKIDCKLIVSVIIHDLGISFFEERISSLNNSIERINNNLKRLEDNKEEKRINIIDVKEKLLSINFDYPDNIYTENSKIEFLHLMVDNVKEKYKYISSSRESDNLIQRDLLVVNENFPTYYYELRHLEFKLSEIDKYEKQQINEKNDLNNKLGYESDLVEFMKNCNPQSKS